MQRRLVALFLSLLPLIAGCIGAQEEGIPDDFHGDDIYPPVKVEAFELTNHLNETFNSSEFDGKVVISVFMFTRCPDVCPVVSANVRWLTSQLTAEELDGVEVVSITVDPWSDSPLELHAYRQNLSLDWEHLTGPVESLEPVWGNFGVGLKTYANDTTDNGTSARHHPDYDYLVDHSTGTILVDKEGYQRVWWGDVDWIPDLALEDVRTLLAE